MKLLPLVFLVLFSCESIRRITNQEIDKRVVDLYKYTTNHYIFITHHHTNYIYRTPQIVPIYSNIVFITYSNIPSSNIPNSNKDEKDTVAAVSTGVIIGTAVGATIVAFTKEIIKDFIKEKVVKFIGKIFKGIENIFRRIFRRKHHVPKINRRNEEA